VTVLTAAETMRQSSTVWLPGALVTSSSCYGAIEIVWLLLLLSLIQDKKRKKKTWPRKGNAWGLTRSTGELDISDIRWGIASGTIHVGGPATWPAWAIARWRWAIPLRTEAVIRCAWATARRWWPEAIKSWPVPGRLYTWLVPVWLSVSSSSSSLDVTISDVPSRHVNDVPLDVTNPQVTAFSASVSSCVYCFCKYNILLISWISYSNQIKSCLLNTHQKCMYK